MSARSSSARSTSDARSSSNGEQADLRRAAVRLTLQFTGLMLVVLAVVAGIVFALVSASIAESADRALEAAVGLDSPQDAPDGTYLTLVDDGRVLSSPDLPEGLADTDALQSVAAGGDEVRASRTVDGRDYLLLTARATGGRDADRVVQVAIDQYENHEEMNRLVVAFLVAGIVAVAVSATVAFLMARRAIRPLAQALALQRRFVADASHELRTPLTVLSTRAQLLRRRGGDGLPADVATTVDDIVDDSRVLTGILDDLLIAADPRSVAEPTPVDLCAAADRAVALLEDEARSRGIVLARDGAAEPVVVSGSDPALLRLVIALVTNAVDHARSTVTVTVVRDGGDAVLTVTDDGDGFAPGVAETAFERFSSSRGADAASPSGGPRHYGLGLAIVAEIVQRHGGRVAIEPVGEGRSGGVVRAWIPVARPTRP